MNHPLQPDLLAKVEHRSGPYRSDQERMVRPRREVVWTTVALLGLYGAGLVHWAWFLQGGPAVFTSGRLQLTAHDWPKECLYLRLLREAVTRARIPYHVDNRDVGWIIDGRFLGCPETILSPHILLLIWLSPEQFVLAHVLLLYSVGYLGSLVLRRRYHLGLLSFAGFFVLFNGNGYITSHLGVGHLMWCGYFLLPFFCLYLLEGLDQPRWRMPALKLALVLFGMLLQGSFHLVIWCWLFLVLLTITWPRFWRQGSFAVGLSGLLGAFRLIPAAMTFWGFRFEEVYSGYENLTALVQATLVLRGYEPGWWEYDMYVGLLGLLFLVYFGIYQRLRPDPDLRPYQYPQLDLPLLLLTLLTVNPWYRPVYKLSVPLVSGERVPSRFIIIPWVMLLVMASVRLAGLLRRVRLDVRSRVVWLVLLGAMAATLVWHSAVWRVPRLEEIDPNRWTPEQGMTLIQVADPVYRWSVWLSAGLSLLALAAWVFLYARWRRSSSPITASTP